MLIERKHTHRATEKPMRLTRLNAISSAALNGRASVPNRKREPPKLTLPS